MDIECLAISKRIDLPSNDILSFKNDSIGLEVDNDILERSKKQQYRRDISSPIFGPNNDHEKVKGEKKKRDKREYREVKREMVGIKSGISEINIYYYKIYE